MSLVLDKRSEILAEMIAEMKSRDWNLEDIDLTNFDEVKNAYHEMQEEYDVEIDEDSSNEDGLSYRL